MDANRVQTTSRVDRTALILATFVGMAMCSAGVGKVASSGQWLTFAGTVGSALGVVIFGIVGARLLGKPLPGIRGDRAALAAVVGLVAAKTAIAAIAF